MIIALNSFSGVGAHRAKLVDLIFPGMLSIHEGLWSVIGGGAKTKKKMDGGGSTCLWSDKQAKSISNMNKNNMLKMLKFTSSVPWHEELVQALTDLGAQDKAEKAQELSQEAAISVVGKRTKKDEYGMEEYGSGTNARKRRKADESEMMATGGYTGGGYTGPWPPKQCSFVLPRDYSTGLTSKQIVQLVKINMQHLPPPPPPGQFPGDRSKSVAEEKASLKKLIEALELMAKFTQSSVLLPPIGPPPVWAGSATAGSGTQLGQQQHPLRLPLDAAFDRNDTYGGVVRPFKRLLRAEIVMRTLVGEDGTKKYVKSTKEKEEEEEEETTEKDELSRARERHGRLLGRIMSVTKILHGEEEKESDGSKSDGDMKGAVTLPKTASTLAKLDDPSGLEDVLVELVGRIETTEIPENVVFSIVVSTLYQHFYDLTSTTTASTTSTASTASTSATTSSTTKEESGEEVKLIDECEDVREDERDTRYSRLLIRIMRAMPSPYLQYSYSRLTRLLLEVPMIPKIVLREVIDQWCEAAGAGNDKPRLKVGLVTLRELILHRSAVRSECLQACFGYTKEGMPPMLVDLSIKMMEKSMYDRNNAVVDSLILQHVRSLLDDEPALLNVSLQGETPLSEQEASDRSRVRLHFFLLLCRRHPPLLNDLLASYVSTREDPVLRITRGGALYCAWVEEMAPKLAVAAVTLFERKFLAEDRELLEAKEAKEAEEARDAPEDEEVGEEGSGSTSGDVIMQDDDEEEKAPAIVRGAVAVAELLKVCLCCCFFFFLGAQTIIFFFLLNCFAHAVFFFFFSSFSISPIFLEPLFPLSVSSLCFFFNVIFSRAERTKACAQTHCFHFKSNVRTF